MGIEVIVIVLIIVILFIYLYWELTTLDVTNYKIKNEKLPKEFNGYKIAHISDFHNTKSNKLKKNILKSLLKNRPDILAITGDFIDSRRTNMNISLEFIKQVKDIPIYYVAGNHESRIKDYPKFKKELTKLGITVLENEKVTLKNRKETIELIGLQDPSFETGELNSEQMKKIVDNYLKSLVSKSFNVVLLHRPELMEVLVKNNIDVAFHGHAHGGQIIIPFIGPIIAPNQGFFPKFTSGVHEQNKTSVVISRGIGNSLCPIRINNHPELIYVTLNK
ncbi:MAG: metallophosphoesterase [Bacilli bacterium]|nr:metallophosphoesterase [Bacilli bacterium]